MSKTILKKLWQVGGDGLTAPGDAAIYLVQCGDQAVLVDAGCGGAHVKLTAHIDGCLQNSARLSHLLLTHCHFDHSGGAQAVRQTYGCQIVAHALDAVFLEAGDSEVTAASWYGTTLSPLTIDIKLEKEETPIAIGSRTISAIHWPGHSPGSLIYHTKVEDKLVLFGQDVHGPIHPALRSDGRLYQQSLKKMAELEADLLLEGHYGVVEGKGAVKQFIHSFMDS